MFWVNLNPEEREALLVLANHLIKSDAKVSKAEQDALDNLEKYMELPDDGLPRPGVEQAIASIAHGTVKSRNATMLELVQLAYADDEYNPKELAVLLSWARQWKLPPGRLQEMENWVKEIRKLSKKAATMLST
jgi:hypothetical protein